MTSDSGAMQVATRVVETEDLVAVRPARSRFYCALFGMAWNASFFVFAPDPTRRKDISIVALLGVTVFALVALREFLLITRAVFRDGHLIISAGPVAPWTKLEVPLVDIDKIEVWNRADGSFRLMVRLHAGRPLNIPLSLDGYPLRATWRTRPFFRASAEEYSFVAERMNAKLEEARHKTGPTYR
jgi:hypothetical protein